MVESTVVHEQRAARNQAMIREVNEQLEGARQDPEQVYQQFVCECADLECIQPVELTIQEYETVRAEGAMFVIAVGHVYPEVERVVSETSRFAVVEKLRTAGEIAEAHDPRARPAE
jgi:hypothetical protein